MSRILATSAPTPRRSTRRPAGCFGNSNWTNIRPRVSSVRRRCMAALSTCRYRRSRNSPAPAATISAAAFAAAWWHWMHGLARASGRLSQFRSNHDQRKRTRSVRNCSVRRARRCGRPRPSMWREHALRRHRQQLFESGRGYQRRGDRPGPEHRPDAVAPPAHR